MAEIILEQIKKNFGTVEVVRALDLVIKDGEFFTFVGPSGCGKSTILNIIAGLEGPTAGKLKFDGQTVNELSPKERDIAMVFQSYALYPHMTVYENMAFPLKMKKIKNDLIEAEVRKVAELLGLEGLLRRKPRELSGGQRQRVALGRAIIRKPRVFLMDEPLSNLDARLRVEMRAELKKLHYELKITTVYVTHDQSEAMSMSDRIAVFYDGRIQQCGPPAEIYMKPENTMVAGFIGSPPMNFVNARIKKRTPVEVDCNGVIIFPFVDGVPGTDDVMIGIRPEDVTVSSNNCEDGIEAEVSLMESAGSFNWVDIIWGDSKLKGVSELDEHLKPGDRCSISFPEKKTLLFESDNGRRI